MMTSQDVTKKRLLHSPLICHICGDRARGMNFNVTTCMACKAFFRRNALLPFNTLRCKRNYNCRITMETRANCPACRLKKCFEFGMKCELIRSFPQDELDSDKMKQLQMFKQQQTQLPWPRPLNLLQNDQSILTLEQWNLLSNIIHVYDNQDSFNRMRYLTAQTSSLPIKLRSKTSLFINFINIYATCTEMIFRQSPDFYSQPFDIRRIIVENNMILTSILNGTFICHKIDIFGSSDFSMCVDRVFWPDYRIRYDLLLKRFDVNSTLWKIMVLIIVFSSNYSIVMYNHQSNIRNISYSINLTKIQDIFVDILWRYLIYQYGFGEAVLRYSSLIKVVLDLLHYIEEILDVEIYQYIYSINLSKTERLLINDN